MQKSVVGYLIDDLKAVGVMDEKECKRLLPRAKAGDKRARDAIVNSNMRFVIATAKRYLKSGVNIEDLSSEGAIALMSAIDKWDESKGSSFLTYAKYWVKAAILSLYPQLDTIRLPANIRPQAKKISEGKMSLSPKKEAYIKKLSYYNEGHASLDDKITEWLSLGETIVDPHSYDVEEQLMAKSLEEDLKAAMKNLSPRQSAVLDLRYGLGGKKPLSLREAAGVLNLSSERVRQIERAALKNLRLSPLAPKLRSYL